MLWVCAGMWIKLHYWKKKSKNGMQTGFISNVYKDFCVLNNVFMNKVVKHKNVMVWLEMFLTATARTSFSTQNELYPD